MKPRSLRQRIAISLTLFSLLVAVPILLVGDWMSERTEQAFWKAMLSAELAQVDVEVPPGVEVRHGVLHSYVWDPDRPEQTRQVPEPLRRLGPGLHDEVRIGDREWAILIRADRAGRTGRTAVTIDITDLESEEAALDAWAVAFALLALAGLALALNWIARRAVLPVTTLAAQLQARPPTASTPFATPFQEREIASVVAALNGYVDRLQGHAQREKHFVEAMSHELRTPLAVILGALEVLEQRTTLAPREAAAVLRIRRTSKELLELAETLLFLSHRQDERVATDAIHLLPLLRTSLERHAPQLSAQGLAVQWGAAEDAVVQGVRPLCEIVINNLLRNCCDHAGEGRVEIALTATELSVSNARTDASVSSSDGAPPAPAAWRGNAGLGLELMQRVCARLGWSLEVCAADGRFIATVAFGGTSTGQR